MFFNVGHSIHITIANDLYSDLSLSAMFFILCFPQLGGVWGSTTPPKFRSVKDDCITHLTLSKKPLPWRGEAEGRKLLSLISLTVILKRAGNGTGPLPSKSQNLHPF